MKKIVSLALLVTFMFACQSKEREKAEETPVVKETAQEEVYQVRGQIVKIAETDPDGNALVTIHHEEIPDVMMTMKMDLKTNVAFLTEISKDDKVSFEMVKTEDGYIMRNVEKLPAETELMIKE